MPKRTLTIATCQFNTSGDISGNLKKMCAQIKKAKSGKADIVQFAECSLTGYGGIDIEKTEKEHYPQLLELGKAIKELQAIAKEFSIYIIIGTHYYVKNKSRPMNSLLIINSEGGIEARYDKRILPGVPGKNATQDQLHYSSGQKPVTFDIKGIKCGLLICHEWRYPELYREYKKLGAEIIFHSWYEGNYNENEYLSNGCELIVNSVRGYAANNYLWISGSNICNKQCAFPGFIVQPDGRILCKSQRNKEHALIETIDFNMKFDDTAFYGRKRFLK